MWGTERGTGLSFGANLKFCFFLYLFLLYNRAIEVFMKVPSVRRFSFSLRIFRPDLFMTPSLCNKSNSIKLMLKTITPLLYHVYTYFPFTLT